MEAAVALGTVPYIPFKKNATGQSRGSAVYHRMYKFYCYQREIFDSRYRQRAQVESAFGSFKQKIGETLASRNFTSQINEAICCAICHNLMILNRLMHETELVPDFLRSTPAPEERMRTVIPSITPRPLVSPNLEPKLASVSNPPAFRPL
jgi:hypothetical protein